MVILLEERELTSGLTEHQTQADFIQVALGSYERLGRFRNGTGMLKQTVPISP